MTIQDHASAYLDRLRGDPELTVYDGAVPKGAVPPYLLVYLTFSTPDAEMSPDKVPLTFDSNVGEARAYCHCVGANGVAARAVGQRVLTRLQNWRPVIGGRDCSPVRWQEGQPAQRDETTGVLVMDQVDVYGFTSVPG